MGDVTWQATAEKDAKGRAKREKKLGALGTAT